jgi:hypothetical protein
MVMSNWIAGQQEQILVNLDNLVDILVKKQGESYSVVGYTPSGFGIVMFKGTKNQAEAFYHGLRGITGSRDL